MSDCGHVREHLTLGVLSWLLSEKEFEKLWAIEVVGMIGAKKAAKGFKKMSAKDFESLETQNTQNKGKQKESSKKRYSNTKQEDFL